MALLGLLLAAVFAPSAQARIESFQSLAPSTVELTAVTADPGTSFIYAQEDQGTKFFRYDPRTNVWTELAPAPINSGNNGGAAYLNGKIYISYTSNSELSVYDIASNSWTKIANPLGEGTGNIVAGNGRLYLAVALKFVSLDPGTGIVTPLAEPPKFTPADCGEGFTRWGGLQVVGGKIYGHQGDACTGFAVYDVAGNTWQELPLAPEVNEEGPVLGSAIDPLTNTYITYGSYPGNTIWRFDLEAGSWTTSSILPFEVEDGGMVYLSLPGYEGIYMVQGEIGEGFGRYTERNQTDLAPSISAKATKGGQLVYSVLVKNNGPERASGVVLSDSLPAKATLVSIGTSQGTCSGTSALTCNLGVLRSGASASLTIKVKARLKKVTNTVTVSSQAVDANPGNDGVFVISKQCVVPKLRKRSLKGAKKALRKANCKPGKVSRRFSGKAKEGKVVRGGKNRGKVLPAGSKVKVVVSRGPKEG